MEQTWVLCYFSAFSAIRNQRKSPIIPSMLATSTTSMVVKTHIAAFGGDGAHATVSARFRHRQR